MPTLEQLQNKVRGLEALVHQALSAALRHGPRHTDEREDPIIQASVKGHNHLHTDLGGFDQNAHHTAAHNVVSHADTSGTGPELDTLTDGSNADALHDHSNHGVTHVAYASIAETDTGTEAGKAVTPDGLQGSNRNIRYIQVRLVAGGTDVAVGAFDETWVCPFTGTLLQSDTHKERLMAYTDTAGETGTMVVDIHLDHEGGGAATIMDTNKLDIEDGEANTNTATTQPDLTTTAVTKGDVFRFEVDAKHTTPAKGLVVSMAIRET